MNMPIQPEASELSIDDTIDAIAREAFEEARRVEEAERYRNNPGPVVPPPRTMIAP
jgi:hypothetical protein